MDRKTRLFTVLLFACTISCLSTSSAFASSECNNVLERLANTEWETGKGLEEKTFRWYLPTTGIATVDLLTTTSGSAWIELSADSCGEPTARFEVIERSTRHLVFAVHSAGPVFITTHSFPSDSFDSSLESPWFRLDSSFVETEIQEKNLSIDSHQGPVVQTSFFVAASVDKAEPEVVDPEPDSLPVGRRLVASLLTQSPAHAANAEPEVVDSEPDSLEKADPEIVDPEPDSLIAASHRIARAPSQVLFFDPICHRTGLDDHSDTRSCATSMPLGRIVNGELRSPRSLDIDTFSFTLETVSHLEIALASEGPEPFYELSSPTGARLAVDRLEVDDPSTTHLAVTLAPGRYFFRIAGSSGAYAIRTMTYN